MFASLDSFRELWNDSRRKRRIQNRLARSLVVILALHMLRMVTGRYIAAER